MRRVESFIKREEEKLKSFEKDSGGRGGEIKMHRLILIFKSYFVYLVRVGFILSSDLISLNGRIIQKSGDV